ncbi:MAG TPA: Gfo/Idh/MocA family oxidoreductase [Solirubrobacteraceae bacterium]|jgi:predicted dehydrogenase
MLQSTVSLMLDDDTQAARQVGVAVVGLGNWGEKLLRVLGDNFDVQVRWICDIDSSRLARCRRRHPDARVTTRLDRILADPGVDAVVLATPAETHYQLAMLVLDSGKHVFVETPLAMSADLAEDLAAVGRARHRIVMGGHTFLYSPPVRAVKRMIESGTLGDIFCISSSRVSLGVNQAAASVIWDLGPHDFSILLYWLSEMPTSVRAVGRDSVMAGIADVAFVTMNFASGIVVNVELSWLAPSKLCRTVVVGSERMVVYEDHGPEPVRLFDCGVADQAGAGFGEYHLARRGADIVSPGIESYEPVESQLGDFVHAIRAGDSMEYQTALALSVVRVAEAADESLRSGGSEVFLGGTAATSELVPHQGLAAV